MDDSRKNDWRSRSEILNKMWESMLSLLHLGNKWKQKGLFSSKTTTTFDSNKMISWPTPVPPAAISLVSLEPQIPARSDLWSDQEEKHYWITEGCDSTDARFRVGKCQIFYTDQYQQTIFYPGEKHINRNIFGTSNLQNRTYGVSCDE